MIEQSIENIFWAHFLFDNNTFAQEPYDGQLPINLQKRPGQEGLVADQEASIT